MYRTHLSYSINLFKLESVWNKFKNSTFDYDNRQIVKTKYSIDEFLINMSPELTVIAIELAITQALLIYYSRFLLPKSTNTVAEVNNN